MSKVTIQDAGWQAIMDDPQLARARSKLSFHEIRLIVQHARKPLPPLDCPRAPAPFRLCPDCDGSFPCQLPERVMEQPK